MVVSVPMSFRMIDADLPLWTDKAALVVALYLSVSRLFVLSVVTKFSRNLMDFG